MRSITVLIFITSFLLLRPFQMEDPGMLFSGDDYSYFAYSTALAFGQYPSFEKEAVDEFQVPPLSRAGVGILAAPFVLAFSVIDRIQHNSIVDGRSKENITHSWSLFGAVFATAFYFWLGCFFCYQGLILFFPADLSALSVALMTLTQGAGLYAFRRPVFSHIYEFFLQACFLFLMLRHFARSKTTYRGMPLRDLAMLSLTACFTLLVRQNGLPYALLFPILTILGNEELRFAHIIKHRWAILITCLAGFLSYLAIKYFPYLWHPEKYAQANAAFETTSFLFQFEAPYFYLKRLFSVLFGLDWGLLFTAPGLLMGALALLRKDLPYRKTFFLLSLPVALNLYIAVIWRSQGSWYGYRYVIYSAIPVFLFPFTFLLKRAKQRSTLLFGAMVAWFIVPCMSMLLFEATPNTILNGVMTEFGGVRIGNLTYQVEVWKVLVTQPLYSLSALLKAGPAYLIYCLGHLTGYVHLLPEKFKQLYPTGFHLETFLKIFILYCLPFLLLKMFEIKREAKS